MPPHQCLPRLAGDGCGACGIDTNARGALGIRTELTKIHREGLLNGQDRRCWGDVPRMLRMQVRLMSAVRAE